MKNWFIAVVAVVSSAAFAQEIGTEISPATPNSGVQTQQQTDQDRPPPPNRRDRREQRRDDGAESPNWDGNRVSASAGSFGIRGSFSAGNFTLPSAANTSNFGSSLGIAWFVSDGFKLLFDLGFALGVVGNDVGYGVNALVGFDYLFRTPADALRPFIHAGAFFGVAGNNSGANASFGVQLGGGAEYFFSPNFSLNARLLIAVPMAVPNGNFVLGITSVRPGVGGTWYF